MKHMQPIPRLAAVGDNCMDVYDQTGEAYPGGNPVNVAVYNRPLTTRSWLARKFRSSSVMRKCSITPSS